MILYLYQNIKKVFSETKNIFQDGALTVPGDGTLGKCGHYIQGRHGVEVGSPDGRSIVVIRKLCVLDIFFWGKITAFST